MLLQILLAFLPPDLSPIILTYLQQHPLVNVFNSTRLSCTFHHAQGGCGNCLSYGPDLCRLTNTPFVNVSLTDMFDTAVIQLKMQPVHLFRCYLAEQLRLRRRYLDEQLRLQRDMYNRVLVELLARHRLRRRAG